MTLPGLLNLIFAYILKKKYLCAREYRLQPMNIRYKAVYILLLVLAFALVPAMKAGSQVRNSEASDSLEVSLLTCSPGPAIYELYGHTAIRVRNNRSGEDWVFNYGMFDFKTPHFVWRFMRGETDYFLGVEPYSDFISSYAKHGRGVTAQLLNLTGYEKKKLFASLSATALIKGWTYRYDFLYDNCTTRAVDEVTDCMYESVEWPLKIVDGRSQRDVIHEFARVSPWAKFGQDLILGSEIDHPADLRELMFSPIYAERFFAGAKVTGTDGSKKPLVSRTFELVKPNSEIIGSYFPITPLIASILLLLVISAFSYFDFKKAKLSLYIDLPLMLLQGGAGCIVFFLFAFSSHPAVGSNWLLLFLNPLHILYMPLKSFSDKCGFGLYYYWSQLIVIIFLVFGAALGLQSLPEELYIIFAAYVLRSATSIVVTRRNIRLSH